MEEKPYERKKLLAVGVASAVIVSIAAVVVVLALMTGRGTKPAEKQSSGDDATTVLFYDVLGNAAKQQMLRVAMYRATYANKADADTKRNHGTEASSVAEVDTSSGKLRSVYATNATRAPEFSFGRCMDGTEYLDDYFASKQPRPTSLAAAAEVLRTNERLFRVTQDLTFVVCPSLGVMANAALELASFRLSDGVFPVTLTETQAENWKNKAKVAGLFTIKDDGMVERDGRKLKKLSFAPKEEDGVNASLYDIFYETGEIDKIKREHPEAQWQYEFIAVNPSNTGSASGFYLIDEATKLPVYSEINGINRDKETDQGASRFNISRTKQTYIFGQPLSLTFESPLELLQ